MSERRLRVVFMGTPEFAVVSLAAVAKHHDIVRVLSQPDRPVGRGGKLTAPPVAAWATAHGLLLAQPRSVRSPDVAAELAALGADVAVVVAYGKILPNAVLAAFPLGCVNVHGSLLPKYRGAAPVQHAVIDGETHSGVSIMQLDEGMDTGPVFAVAETAIGSQETSGELMERLAQIGAVALVEVLATLATGTAVAVPQPSSGASHARMLEKSDGVVDFQLPATAVSARIRGVDPWPGATAKRGDHVLKLFGARVAETVSTDGVPGQVLDIDSSGMHVSCGGGSVVVISDVQVPGRKRLSAQQVAAGRGVAVGDVLESAP